MNHGGRGLGREGGLEVVDESLGWGHGEDGEMEKRG